jgi:OFA family oxalate/formate antiporter-like MFS transporter
MFLIITVPLAQFVNNPETPVVSSNPAVANKKTHDLSVKQMLKTKEFYLLWFMFFAGATGGLMTIGGLKPIVAKILGADAAFQLVAFAAIANALGRPAAGAISGKLGRGKTMTILYIMQASALFFFNSLSGFLPVFAAACMIYFAYGSMLSVFPSACGDNYGTKNLGLNYGILFSAWGVGGIVGPMIGSKLADVTGNYTLAFTLAAGMLLVAAFIGFIYKPYVHQEA